MQLRDVECFFRVIVILVTTGYGYSGAGYFILYGHYCRLACTDYCMVNGGKYLSTHFRVKGT